MDDLQVLWEGSVFMNWGALRPSLDAPDLILYRDLARLVAKSVHFALSVK